MLNLHSSGVLHIIISVIFKIYANFSQMKGSKISVLSPLQTRLLLALGLLVLSICLFWPATRFGFIEFDDTRYAATNTWVNTGFSWENIKWAFSSAHENWWLPLLWLSFMLDATLFGAGPFGYHLTNILLHAVNGALLFWVLSRITGSIWRSVFIAALFAVHPLRVEAVAWVTARKDVLSGLFWMLSLLAYAQYVQRPTTLRRWLVPLLMLLGLLSKAIVIALPPVLLLLDYWPLRRAGDPLDRREWKKWTALLIEKLPLIGLALVFIVINLNTHVSGRGAHTDISALTRLGLIPPNYWEYLGKLFWPVRLALVYVEHDVVDGAITAAALIGLLLVTLLLLFMRHRHPALLVGWCWFLLTLLPVIRGLRLGIASMADRFTYLPCIGLFLLVTWGVVDFLPSFSWRKPLLALSAAALIVTCFAAARHYLAFWKDSETLFLRVLAIQKENYVISVNLASMYNKAGRWDDEITSLQKLLQSKPENPMALISLGRALERKGLTEKANDCFDRAERYAAPFETEMQIKLGEHYALLHNFQKAIRHFQWVLQEKPDENDTRNNLGMAYLLNGDPDEALPYFEEVIYRDPHNDRARWSLGKDLLALNRPEEAIKAFREAVQLVPDKVEYQSSLAVAMGQAGHVPEAIAVFKRLLKAHPESSETLNNLAWLLAANPDEAVYDPESAKAYALKAAEQTNRQDPNVLDTLALTYAANRQFDLAIHTAEEAMEKARSTKQDDVARRIAVRLAAYQQHRPWREVKGGPAAK